MGLSAPYTKLAAEKIRPEGPGRPGADHPGYGTFFYTKKSTSTDSLFNKVPVAPAGIIAVASNRNVTISWIAPIGAKTYTLESKEPEQIAGEKLDFTSIVSSKQTRKISLYDPWKNQWLAEANNIVVVLPTFKRSIVIKIEKI